MVVIINGSVGCGKTSVSWALQRKFDKAVMLDGDYIGAVHPFAIYDEARITYLYDTMEHLVAFHRAHGYNNFVINYVFESAASLEALKGRFEKTGMDVRCYWLTCSEGEQQKRIHTRATRQLAWELNRFFELNAIQEAAAQAGFIGKRINTDGRNIEEVTSIIWKDMERT